MQEDSGGKVAQGKTRHGCDRERPAAERLVRETVGKSTEESAAAQRRQSPDKRYAVQEIPPTEGKDGVSERAVSSAVGRGIGEASSAQLRDAAEAPSLPT